MLNIRSLIEKYDYKKHLTSNDYSDNFQSGFHHTISFHFGSEECLSRNWFSQNLSPSPFGPQAAFDMVVHTIMLDRLVNWIGLSDTVLNWFKFHLQDRNYFV